MTDRVEKNFDGGADTTADFDVEGLFTISIDGTFTGGSIFLERVFKYSSLDNSSYRVVKEYTDEVEELGEDVGDAIRYRLRASSDFAGDVNVALVK